jgi:predicted transcriptional regulator
MIPNSSQFKVNSPNVVSETIDGETVIVSLDKGTYYSLDQVGADIWSLIEQQLAAGQIVDAIANRFTGDREAIETSIKTLIAQLRAEELIIAAADSETSNSSDFLANTTATPTEFIPPILQKYSDMQELLMLDPIHEVDLGEGWPEKKEETFA